MKNAMRTRGFSTLIAAVGAASLMVLPVHQATAQAKVAKGPRLPATLVIYRGDSLQTSGLTLANWGSGAIDEDTGKIFSGTELLKVTTHGMYQGAILTFAKPVNLAPFIAGKFNYLTVALFIPEPSPNSGATGGYQGYQGYAGKGGKGSGAFGPGYPGGGGSQGAPSGGLGALGGYGGSTKNEIATQKNRKLENLRIVLGTAGGRSLEVMLPVANATEENQWKVVSIPLSAVPGLTADDAQIKSLRLFGDAPSTINIGSIGIVEDFNPITVQSINDKTVQRLLRYQYVATASAGITPLTYSWDWDASDGIQDETPGRNIAHAFRKASADDSGKSTDFVVTVTVSDLYNIKSPVKTTFKVHVTP